MTHTTHRRSYARIVWLVPLLVLACGGSDEEGESENPAEDVTPPITTATPPGGAFPGAQTVKLTSNEAATIYYTLDGSVPVIGAPNTLSGPSPVNGLAVNTSPTQIRFFGVDAAGNEEALRTHAYVIDTTAPVVSIVGPAPAAFGLMTTQTISWQSTEAGTYTVEAGGTGTPGSGFVIEVGTVAASSTKATSVNGWELSSVATTPLRIFVSDAATNVGSVAVDLDRKETSTIPMTPLTSGMAVAPDGASLFLSWRDAHEVAQYDIDPTSPNYEQQIAGISVGMQPGDLAITPDGARLYVGHLIGLDEIETGSQGVETISIPGVDRILDVAIAPDASRAYVARSGILFAVDIDSESPQFHSAVPVVSNNPLFTSAYLAATPDGRFLLVAWTGFNAYSLAIVDIDPESPTLHTVIATPVPTLAGIATQPTTSNDGAFGYIATSTGALARVNFSQSPIAIDRVNTAVNPALTLVMADDEQLLVVNSSGMFIVDPESLASLHGIFSPFLTRVGAMSPGGADAYLLRAEFPGVSQFLWTVPLE